MSMEVYYVTCPKCKGKVSLAYDVVDDVFSAICDRCRMISELDVIRMEHVKNDKVEHGPN
jgi:predicted  nucleic acid-binding Zn ribbon protein